MGEWLFGLRYKRRHSLGLYSNGMDLGLCVVLTGEKDVTEI